MASWTMSALLLIGVYLILMNDVEAHRKIPLNDADKEECKKYIGGLLEEFVEESSYKERSKVCQITCAYKEKLKDEIKEELKIAPDGQKCCFKGDKTKVLNHSKGSKGGKKLKGKCENGKCIQDIIEEH